MYSEESEVRNGPRWPFKPFHLGACHQATGKSIVLSGDRRPGPADTPPDDLPTLAQGAAHSRQGRETGVPIYPHPTTPRIPEFWKYGVALAGLPFGFGLETSMEAMRLVLSGAFDAFLKLKVILGHEGRPGVEAAQIQ
jgi:hypothetical protein